MDYFDFAATDDRVFIPKSCPKRKQKEKSCLVDRNKISKIKDAKNLDKYNLISSKTKNQWGNIMDACSFLGVYWQGVKNVIYLVYPKNPIVETIHLIGCKQGC